MFLLFQMQRSPFMMMVKLSLFMSKANSLEWLSEGKGKSVVVAFVSDGFQDLTVTP